METGNPTKERMGGSMKGIWAGIYSSILCDVSAPRGGSSAGVGLCYHLQRPLP